MAAGMFGILGNAFAKGGMRIVGVRVEGTAITRRVKMHSGMMGQPLSETEREWPVKGLFVRVKRDMIHGNRSLIRGMS